MIKLHEDMEISGVIKYFFVLLSFFFISRPYFLACHVSMQEHHIILGLETRFEAKARAQTLRFGPGFEVKEGAHTIAGVFLYFQNIFLYDSVFRCKRIIVF